MAKITSVILFSVFCAIAVVATDSTGEGKEEKEGWKLRNNLACKFIAKPVGAGIGAAVVKYGIPFVLTAAGFTPAGVAAGSFAALWQSWIGNVAAGSAFSTLQSLGALGLSAGNAAVIYESAQYAGEFICESLD